MASNSIFAQSDIRPSSLAAGSRCPACDQAVPNDKLAEIQARMDAKERERHAETERQIREQVEQQTLLADARAKSEVDAARRETAKAKAEAEDAKKFADQQVAKVKAEAEAAARVQVETERKAAAAESAAKVRAELQQEQQAAEKAKADAEAAQKQAMAARVDAEAAKKKAIEETAKAQADAEAAKKKAIEETAKAQADAETAKKVAAEQSAKALADANAREARAREEARKVAELESAGRVAAAEQAAKEAIEKAQNQQAAHEAELMAQRAALEKNAADRENAALSKAFEEKVKLQQQVEALNRKVQQQTADQLGEGAELDLYEELKKEFPDDIVKRITKGVAGADIRHQVRHNGLTCGTILYDSKNRSQWRYEYAEKLRTDQLSDGADHAVLSTNLFPQGEKQLCIHEGVILACPARVLVVADLLRSHILLVHTLRLSAEERVKKTAQLYDYMTSERSANLFERMTSLTEQVDEQMVREIKAHEKGWRERGEMNRQLQKTHATLRAEVERIIGTGPA